jgi:ABC-type antimicrobial peptide transport system permease subunit
MATLSGRAPLALRWSRSAISGLVPHAVKQSTREIGIRMATGATSGSVRRRFLAATSFAILVPARRAARTNPLNGLRHE